MSENLSYDEILAQAEIARGERNFRRILELIELVGDDLQFSTKLIEDSAFFAVRHGFGGIPVLAGFAEHTCPISNESRRLLRLLGMCFQGAFDEARRSICEPGVVLSNTEIYLAIMLFLGEGDVESAELYCRMASQRPEPNGFSREELAAVTSYRLRRAANKPIAGPARHKLSICASLKNEGEYINEWVEYHHSIGVDHFFLYNNDSSDDTREKIERLSDRYSITITDNDRQPAQTIAMQHFLDNHRHATEWVAFIDGDEFIHLGVDNSVKQVLSRFDHASAIACSWMIFGSNGHHRKPEGPCLQAFTRRAATPDNYVKTIARPERVVRMVNTHHYLVDGTTVDGSGRPVMIFKGKISAPADDFIRINHYIVKSREQWEQKRLRGRSVGDDHPAKYRSDEYFNTYDLNEVEDRTILRLIKEQ